MALTLRTLGGLTTKEIARAFLVTEPTIAQRLVRAKRKIREAGIPTASRRPSCCPNGCPACSAVLYLVFNEGYASTEGPLVRTDLCDEAIRLARIVAALLPERGRGASGCSSLMLLQHSRRDARVDADGRPGAARGPGPRDVEHATRSTRGWRCSHGRRRSGSPGRTRSRPRSPPSTPPRPHVDATDWPAIVRWYRALLRVQPSPVVALNAAVAVAMADGPQAGLAMVDRLDETGALERYYLLPATRADLLRRLGRNDEAAAAYRRALDAGHQPGRAAVPRSGASRRSPPDVARPPRAR